MMQLILIQSCVYCPIRITIEEVARHAISMGVNSLLAEIDIKATYGLVSICPTDHMGLGMCWKEQVPCCLLDYVQHQEFLML